MPDLEKAALTPAPVDPAGFNPAAKIPYGLETNHVRAAMEEFIDFLGFVNTQLATKQIPRLEAFLMPANFSSIVGEFMCVSLPTHCSNIVKNTYHNGHPDLIPRGQFPNDCVQHSRDGIEVKGSRYPKGWQGHNAEDCWLMVFVFEANSARDQARGLPPRPFRFVKVVGAQLAKSDWKFAGRAATSRRTITASVLDSGYQKMESNWIYRAARAARI